jgi:uncharacterized SAM-binding protein YcdF (DUF218 family)
MVTLIGIGLVGFVLFIAFLFVARRLLRLALKLAFVGALAATLLAGVMLGWWRGWFNSAPAAERPVTQTNQRANSNRRSPR